MLFPPSKIYLLFVEGGVDDLTCTFFRFEQPLKASYPIWVNDLDNQTSCNFSQDEKAVCPISVTLSGMEISVNFLQGWIRKVS